MFKILAILLMSNIAYAQNCTNAKSQLDTAVAAVKLACVDKVASPTPTPTPVSTPTPAPAWTKCADEGGRCDFSGTRQVRYGTTDKWAYKVALGSIGCNNAVFGDPAVGIAKACYYSSQTTIIPAPTPTPVVVQPPPTSSGSGIFIGSIEYPNLAAAGEALKDGQTILITKSLVDQGTAIAKPGKFGVRCLEGVVLDWKSGRDLRLPWGKAVINIDGDVSEFTIENCEIKGAQIYHSQGGNGAAVRLMGNIQVANFINVNFHHNNNGILSDASKVINIERSKFHYNGFGPDQDGHTHNIYIGARTDQLNVKDSYFGPVYEGNVFKTRSKATTVTGSVFESKSDVNSSYLLDMPNGGAALIKGNVFVKAPNQGQRTVLSYGVEGIPTDGRSNSYEFANNIVVADAASDFFRAANFTGTPNFHDNTMVGSFGLQVNQSNTKAFANRAEAGIAAAPAIPAIPSMGIMNSIMNFFGR